MRVVMMAAVKLVLNRRLLDGAAEKALRLFAPSKRL